MHIRLLAFLDAYVPLGSRLVAFFNTYTLLAPWSLLLGPRLLASYNMYIVPPCLFPRRLSFGPHVHTSTHARHLSTPLAGGACQRRPSFSDAESTDFMTVDAYTNLAGVL
jgi:hypothetical protein